jgi:diguanylate cyclase (GGDEF)-like protein
MKTFTAIFSFIFGIWRRSIRRQLIAGFGIASLALLLGSGYFLLEQQRNFLHRFGEERAISLAHALSIGSSSWALANDLVGLQEVVQGFAKTPDLQRAYFITPRGEVLASTNPDEIGFFVSDPTSRKLLASDARDAIIVSDQANLISAAHPVIAGGRHLGWLRIEMTQDSANKNLAKLRKIWIEFTLIAMLTVLLVSLFLAHRLTRGLDHLMRVATKVEQGRSELRADVGREDEIGVLARHLDRMLNALDEQEQKIRSLAFYDALTKLPNRRLLLDRLGQAMSASKRSGRYAALMFIDLDNFKPLNDKHGHDVGDLLLIEVARRISNCMREVDTVARFGGDEFIVMLSELTTDKQESSAQAGLVAEKIRASLAEPYLLTVANKDTEEPCTIEHHCTSSIGVALFINHEVSPEDLIKWADKAMYQAKEDGRNRTHFFQR